MNNITYDVRVHQIEKRRNAKREVTSYRALWKAGRLWKNPFVMPHKRIVIDPRF